ncbi:hypothetical protein CsSME_00018600 [Camellia sinensis var. sinensis]
MGALVKLVDPILFLVFTVIALATPLIDGQTCLSVDIFPKVLVDLKLWYTSEYGDYLFTDKPNFFFVGLVWLELLFQWPLCLANLYAILAGKSWFPTTCLIYGATTFTSMAAILSELMRSNKASDKLLVMYSPFMGFAVLAILQELHPHSSIYEQIANAVNQGKLVPEDIIFWSMVKEVGRRLLQGKKFSWASPAAAEEH